MSILAPDVGAALFGGLVEHLKEQLVEGTKARNQLGGEEAVRLGEGGRVAGVVAAQLAFEQLEKQQAVDPGQAQLQGHAKQLLLRIGPVGRPARPPTGC